MISDHGHGWLDKVALIGLGNERLAMNLTEHAERDEYGHRTLNGVNPNAYLAATLRAILDAHPQSRIEDLMPWRFPTASSLAV